LIWMGDRGVCPAAWSVRWAALQARTDRDLLQIAAFGRDHLFIND
jgi:hypothetical protein